MDLILTTTRHGETTTRLMPMPNEINHLGKPLG